MGYPEKSNHGELEKGKPNERDLEKENSVEVEQPRKKEIEESVDLEVEKPSSGSIHLAMPGISIHDDSSLKHVMDPPPWFTPKRLLVIFCVINLLNYVDRGVIASNGVNGSIRTCTDTETSMEALNVFDSLKFGTWRRSYIIFFGDFNLNYFQDGILSSAFMVGLLVASPIFATLSNSCNPFRLIGVGLSVWTFATAGCGFSFDFWSITIFRMLVGVGEASFISLAAPFIDDNAPVAQKTAWLAAFYMCIPSGIALGYVYGGLVGSHFSWRLAFFGESILMLPFAILGFFLKPLYLKGFASSQKKELDHIEIARPETQGISNGTGSDLVGNETLNNKIYKRNFLKAGMGMAWIQFCKFWQDLKLLLVDKVYVTNVLGYVSYNFVIGAYSYWGPKAGYDIYHMSNADLMFGGITIVCGIFGTLGGGYILDRIQSTLSNAFKLLSGATFIGAVFCFGAFCSKSLYVFLSLFAVGELLVFATQAPVNYVCLHCVSPSQRPLSMAMSTVAIHIFGDVPSSPLVGVLQDAINDWRTTALILTSILFLAASIWFLGIFLHSVDKFNEESQHDVAPLERSNLTPLLDETALHLSDSNA